MKRLNGFFGTQAYSASGGSAHTFDFKARAVRPAQLALFSATGMTMSMTMPRVLCERRSERALTRIGGQMSSLGDRVRPHHLELAQRYA